MMNERQQKFCEIYVQNGGKATEAARAAGYKEGPGIRVTAHNLLKLPHVQAEVDKQIRVQMAQHGPAALARIKELMESDNPQVALKAAMDYADRAGLKPPDKHEITYTDERTDEEITASINAHIAELEYDKRH